MNTASGSEYTRKAGLWLFGFLVLFVAFGLFQTRMAQAPGWVPASGRLYSGVQLYWGAADQKMLVGTVLGGNERHRDIYSGRMFRGLKVRYPDGREEWKDRSAVATDPRWCVRAEDPAIRAAQWQEFDF